MLRALRVILAGSLAALIGAGCNNPASSNSTPISSSAATVAAFDSAPPGYSNLTSSFLTSGNGPFLPTFGGPYLPGVPNLAGPGPMHGGQGLMCGGLGGAFLGDGLAAGFGPGPFGRGGPPALFGTCTYSSATGEVTCPPITIGGLTITRSATYIDSTGNHEPSIDSITNTITTTVQVSGTITRPDHGLARAIGAMDIDSTSTTVSEMSTQTITGLAPGDTARTINSTSSGTETTTGTSTQGAFTSVRSVGDTIAGLVIPVPVMGMPDYPIAGKTIRAAGESLTVGTGTPTTESRREVVTYDGSDTARVVITQNGAMTTCTQMLPHGRLSCQ